MLYMEVEVFLSLDHPHICRLFDVYEDVERVHMVMECCEGGELHDHLLAAEVISERDATDAAYQMLVALKYLHERKIVHRDIKMENFLYDGHCAQTQRTDDTKNTEKPKRRKSNLKTHEEAGALKLIDFGFSSVWKPNEKVKLACGTLAYTAPEVILESYTHMCDMWSLGVIVFILLVRHMPFRIWSSAEKTALGILNSDFEIDKRLWSRVSNTAFEFTMGLLRKCPEQRLTAALA